MKQEKMESSSAEEENLIQMVQDFIESRSPSPISITCSKVLPFDHHHLTLQEILGNATGFEIRVFKKIMKYFTNVKCERKTGSLRRWLVYKLKKDGFFSSLCKTKNTWIPSLDFAGCDYEYIDIVMKEKDDDDGSTRLIVDLDFKSQFELARPTSNYKHLLDTLPPIFVGNEEKLLNIVSVLCSAAKKSLKENGLHIPPWRQTSYMQSKWISSKVNSKAGAKVGKEDDDDQNGTKKWSPPKIMPKRRDFRGGSALTNQFSNMRINCC